MPTQSSTLFDAVTPEAVKSLLRSKANPNQTDHMGRTPLHYARSRDIASLLLESKCIPCVYDHRGLSPLYTISNPDVFRYLVDSSFISISDAASTSLHIDIVAYHIISENYDILKLLANNYNINIGAVFSRGTHPLHYARSASMIQFLLDHNANVKDISSNDSSPLYICKDRNMVKLLINAQVDPNTQDPLGYTPLHHARNYDVAAALLEYKADPLIYDSFYKSGSIPAYQSDPHCSPLHSIIQEIETPYHNALQDITGQEIPERDLHSVLYYSDREYITNRHNDYINIIQLFINHNCCINIPDRSGFSPLYYAKSLPIFDYLLQNNADPYHIIIRAKPEILKDRLPRLFQVLSIPNGTIILNNQQQQQYNNNNNKVQYVSHPLRLALSEYAGKWRSRNRFMSPCICLDINMFLYLDYGNDPTQITSLDTLGASAGLHYYTLSLLLDYGLDPFIQDKNGCNISFYFSEPRQITYLLRSGVDMNHTNIQHETALQVRSQEHDIVDAILSPQNYNDDSGILMDKHKKRRCTIM